MAIDVRGIEVDIDPFVRDTFPKWMVQIGAEVDVSSDFRGTTDVRTAKVSAKDRIDPFEFVTVFSELTEDERALLLLTPESHRSKWHMPGWGGGSSGSAFKFEYMYPAGSYGIYRLVYSVHDGRYDEFGSHEISRDVSYTVDNIIGVVVDKVTTRYYGLTSRFIAWLRDETVSREEKVRRSAYARRIVNK